MRVRVLTSFNGLRKGETATVTEDGYEQAQRFVAAGHLEVVEDGTGEDRSGGPETGDPGSEHDGAAESGSDGGEPGQGFGSGGYGAAAG